MSDSNSNENKQPSIPSHNEDSAPPADSQDQGVLDTVKSQINSTGNSLVELGNKTSAMAGESFNEVKNKAGSISPGEVYNNVREQVQSTTSGDNGNQQDEEPTEHHDPDESKDHEHIDNMEREKIMEFLQEKYKSTANMPSGK